MVMVMTMVMVIVIMIMVVMMRMVKLMIIMLMRGLMMMMIMMLMVMMMMMMKVVRTITMSEYLVSSCIVYRLVVVQDVCPHFVPHFQNNVPHVPHFGAHFHVFRVLLLIFEDLI